MGVHGGAVVEKDSVLVQDIHLTLRRDVAKDVRGIRGAHHFVECDPVSRALTTRALIEINGGGGTHVELIPVEESVLGRLLDIDVVGIGSLGGIGWCGKGRPIPSGSDRRAIGVKSGLQGSIRVLPDIRFQPACLEAVGNISGIRFGGGSGLFLQLLHRRNYSR